MERRQRFNKMELVAGMLALGLLVPFVPVACGPHGHIQEKGNITKGISNARQIVMALKLYADDHDGRYPDATLTNPKSSNEVFRILFKEDTIDSEAVFGCTMSPFVPDGNIGESKERNKALEPGENHWAMTQGLKDSMAGNIPLVYENPVTATWPPKWNMKAKGTMTRGRAWSTGVIIGMNDGGAQILPLVSKKGKEVGLKPDPATGKDLFEAAIHPAVFPVGKVLDVE